jgi:hypothetical protein
VAAGLVHEARLGPQLVARAAWWSSLVVGELLTIIGGPSEKNWGFVLLLLCGAALLFAGGRGLAEAEERETRAPAAFRSSLLLLMVLAIADAQTFLLMGMLGFSHDCPMDGWALSIAGLVLCVGFVGLYRLAVWGAVVNAVACVAVLVLDIGGALRWDGDQGAVAVLAGLQVVSAAPMLLALAIGRPLPRLQRRQQGAAFVVLLGALVLVGALGVVGLLPFRR